MTVRMDPEVAEPIINRFRDLAAEFDNSSGEFEGQSSTIVEGCGEFSSFVQDGTDAHLISWYRTFQFYRETAALIAGNTNVVELDLQRLDEDLSHDLEI